MGDRVDLGELPTALRDRGVRLVVTDGWEQRLRPPRPERTWLQRGYGATAFVGQVNHHTAISGPCTDSTALAMIRGRSDLPGPIANGHGGVGPDGTAVCYLIAARRARHAGPGSPVLFEELLRDVAPTGDARARKLKDSQDTHGNRSLFGWEWQHPGDASGWPDELIELMVGCNAALAELAGWPAARSIAHREWTARKIDPSWRGDLRALIHERLEDRDMPLNDDDKAWIKAQREEDRAWIKERVLDPLVGEVRRVLTTVKAIEFSALDDSDLNRIAKAVADEQARRQES